MLKINNTYNKTSKNKLIRNLNKPRENFINPCNNNYLSKSLALLGILGSTILPSCEWDKVNYIKKINPYPIDSNLLINSVDNILNSIGLIVHPNKSIKEINSIKFDSNKGESLYYIVDTISNNVVKLKKIKFNQDLSREDSEIYIMKSNTGLQIFHTEGGQTSEIQLIPENNTIKVLQKENNIFVEKSSLHQISTGAFTQEFIDGSKIIYNNIQNNIEVPENIYFEPPEEHEDVIIFQ